jgi:glycosyltransferase involved in cell wall biosynthesis
MSGASVLLVDYAGHAFTYELARTLGERRAGVEYAYCATTLTPRGDLESLDALAVHPLGSGWVFEKYETIGRLRSELRLGRDTARLVRRRRPEVVVTANMPIVSAVLTWIAVRSVRSPYVLWFQDSQGGLASTVGARVSVPARVLGWLETFVLRRAQRVVAIGEAMRDDAVRRGVCVDAVRLLENWAPIDRLPLVERDNAWAREHGLVGRTCFLYSGTLARKHDPSLMADLAEHLDRADPTAVVVVVSEGPGSDYLREVVQSTGLGNLKLLPYQEFTQLPEVLASADVLCAVLEKDAGRFSVPSKILSYLCAGRAVLASMPLDNLSSTVLAERSGAGVVVPPGDTAAFLAAAESLRLDPERRNRMGEHGRRHAEANFSAGAVADRFTEAALTGL